MALDQKTLVLTQGYQPHTITPWQRALCMSLLDKVEVLENYARSVRTVTVAFPVPAVVRLRSHYRPRPHGVRFSRQNVYLRDDHECQYCGKECSQSDLTLDHVVPRVHGGTTTWTNVVACCKDCNRRKGGRTPEQAGFSLRKRPARPHWNPMSFSYRLPQRVPDAWRGWIFE
ncbi:MAG: HNH endonuclease [Myxococcales bacterium]|nr:HNH endonuclease [Myxococcales bacterium]MCB9748927.1 HNH endonuclease [Myxococcales bacterium]